MHTILNYGGADKVTGVIVEEPVVDTPVSQSPVYRPGVLELSGLELQTR